MPIHPPLVQLTNGLNSVIRQGVNRRYDAMLRELGFLRERQDEDLAYVVSKGWAIEKIEVLFLLNCVYQLCIGPLQSSARITVDLGGQLPIHHGAEVFGPSRAAATNQMVSDFMSMVSELGLSRNWMTQNTCGDLIYWIARQERDLDSIREI